MKDAEMIAREPDDERVERVADWFADNWWDGCEVKSGGGRIAACIGPCACREAARDVLVIAAMGDQWRAGYEAAREQAAGIADAETGKTPHGNYDYGPNVAHRLRAAIRSMEPDSVVP